MSEEESLRQVIADYQKYVSASDIQGYTNLFKEDVIWMPPNAPDRLGKPEVFKAEAAAFSRYTFNFQMAPIEIRQLSDVWAMVLCSSQGVMTPRGESDGIKFQYRVLFMMEKQPDSRWLIASQIWNQKPGEGPSASGGPW